MEVKSSHIVLDACCVLNFCASGRFVEILKSIPAKVIITEVVRKRELLTLQRLDEKENSDSLIQFEAALEKKILTIVDFESDLEEETFVNYAFEMGDDGESATGSIAFHRGWSIATDDKRATAFFKREAPSLQILSTLEIVKFWSEDIDLPEVELQCVLNNIRTKGHYIPHKIHPLLDWWKEHINLNS